MSKEKAEMAMQNGGTKSDEDREVVSEGEEYLGAVSSSPQGEAGRGAPEMFGRRKLQVVLDHSRVSELMVHQAAKTTTCRCLLLRMQQVSRSWHHATLWCFFREDPSHIATGLLIFMLSYG